MAPTDVEIARIDAETRLINTRANAALAEADARKRINDASDLHSEQIARESQFARRDELNLRKAQEESRNAEFAFSIQQANNRIEEENELRKQRIKERRVAREKFWEKILPLTLLEMRNGLR